jgi:hypothetical protein
MRLYKTITTVTIIIPLLMLSACMKNYGRLAIDAQVKRDFQAGVIQPDLQYYYAGRENMPYAIIGIDRAYTVPSRYWISFTPEPDQLRKMSGNIFHKGLVDPYGSLITSPEDKIVGIWYSNLYNYSVRVDQQTRTVQILFPNPENNDQPGM